MSDKKFAVMLTLLTIGTLCLVVVLMAVVFTDAGSHLDSSGRTTGSRSTASLKF